MRRRVAWIVIVVAVPVLVLGLWAFQPWKAFTSSNIDEALPTAPVVTNSTAADTRSGPEVLAEGRFVSQEHETSGVARVVRLADGSRVLRLAELAGSDGPDLHVWLTDQEAGGDWFKYDDGRHVPLGKLKATHGNQNYEIPADLDLGGLRSVVIWCDRFNVAFGSAPLAL
ncbi:hypothetical protein GCM10012275_53630 [Longimycelium tulufanense]|uniref:DM13 domain-containing protein n=1 Tax=Longimycelium tulufanense TaxID=907463 RepID=A0A8J3FXR2_9PSEU|nr:hypothetical protein GCM10012275_53630 [Longimycelium tulufanense]